MESGQDFGGGMKKNFISTETVLVCVLTFFKQGIVDILRKEVFVEQREEPLRARVQFPEIYARRAMLLERRLPLHRLIARLVKGASGSWWANIRLCSIHPNS